MDEPLPNVGLLAHLISGAMAGTVGVQGEAVAAWFAGSAGLAVSIVGQNGSTARHMVALIQQSDKLRSL